MKDMAKNSYVSLLKAVVLIIAGLILLVYPGAVLTTVASASSSPATSANPARWPPPSLP